MKAYLAVIKDSFREAFASRVLWILLVLITLLLLLLAPLGVKDEVASGLNRGDISTGSDFSNKLVEQSQSERPLPGKHIWKMLPRDLQEQMTQMQAGENGRNSFRVLRSLIDKLNEMLARSDFYDKAAWSRYPLGEEAQPLLERGVSDLSETELKRFNRLALDAAYPADIRPVQKMATRVVYFGYEIGGPLPANREMMRDVVLTVLMQVMTLLVGVLGVFVAILVTASIIPHMFEPGAIDLMLSRPLSRSLLFLSKFIGGCTFILLNSAYLITGLWLYVGLRFDIWSNKLLLCVPVFLFLFAIYYSVSAFAGVVWKNAVVSVVITILFWAACFAVGTSKGVVETIFLNPERFAVLVPAGESLLAANKSGQTFQWQPDDNTWQPVFTSGAGDAGLLGLVYPMVGPIYDSQADQLVAIASSRPGVRGFAGSGTIVVGKRSNDWERIPSISTPPGTQTLFIESEGTILIAGAVGIFRLEGDSNTEQAAGNDAAPQGKAGKFVEVGPKGTDSWSPPFAADRNPQDGSLAIFSRGTLNLLKPAEDGRFTIAQETDLETKELALVAYAGKTVLVALGSGEIRTFDAKTLKPTGSFQPFDSDKPQQVAAATNGRWFTVQFHNNKTWTFDAKTGEPLETDIAGQGNISAIAFTADNKLLVADRYPRVLEYDLETDNVTRRFEAGSGRLELFYRYILNPIYTVFPKPGELDSMVMYLLTDEKAPSLDIKKGPENLQDERATLNIWEPVWSNLAFLAVMLGLTCLYIERKDF